MPDIAQIKQNEKRRKLLREVKETHSRGLRRQERDPMFFDKRMVFSPALLSLRTATAFKVYFLFLTKCQCKKVQIRPGCKNKEWRILNNGQIQFTYEEAEKYGIKRGAFRNAIDELLRVGLINITHQGSGLEKDVSLYAISDRWEEFGTPEFEEQVREKRKLHYGFAKGNKRAAARWAKERISQHRSNALDQVRSNALEGEKQPCEA